MKAKTLLLIASLLFMVIAISAQFKEAKKQVNEAKTEKNEVTDKEQDNKEAQDEDENEEESALADMDRELEEDSPITDLEKEVNEEDLTEVNQKAWVNYNAITNPAYASTCSSVTSQTNHSSF